MSWYCTYAQDNPHHRPYHDTEYGFPVTDDQVIFERLCLEIFQAGLSWDLMIKRREGFNQAFENFDIACVAAYTEEDRARLLSDARIIRNRLKVNAIIENARRFQALALSHGSFAAWLASHHPLTKPDWVKLFRKTLLFTGPEVVNEFLMSLGYLPGSHHDDCPVMHQLRGLNVPWMQAETAGFVYG